MILVASGTWALARHGLGLCQDLTLQRAISLSSRPVGRAAVYRAPVALHVKENDSLVVVDNLGGGYCRVQSMYWGGRSWILTGPSRGQEHQASQLRADTHNKVAAHEPPLTFTTRTRLPTVAYEALIIIPFRSTAHPAHLVSITNHLTMSQCQASAAQTPL